MLNILFKLPTIFHVWIDRLFGYVIVQYRDSETKEIIKYEIEPRTNYEKRVRGTDDDLR